MAASQAIFQLTPRTDCNFPAKPIGGSRGAGMINSANKTTAAAGLLLVLANMFNPRAPCSDWRTP